MAPRVSPVVISCTQVESRCSQTPLPTPRAMSPATTATATAQPTTARVRPEPSGWTEGAFRVVAIPLLPHADADRPGPARRRIIGKGGLPVLGNPPRPFDPML